MIRFLVSIAPKPKNSRRALPVRGRDGVTRARVVESRETKAWTEAFICAAARHRPARPLEGPVHCRLTFVLARPKRASIPGRAWAPVRPDVENLVKATHDALTAAGFWRDDGQVVSLVAQKVYASAGERACIEVVLEEVG